MVDVEGPDRPVREFVDEVRVVTLVTHAEAGWSGRPLTVAEEFDGLLRFLVSRSAGWVSGLDRDEAVVVLADPGKNTYAVLTGTVTISDHRGTVERIWSVPAKAFFSGPDDPDVAVAEFQAATGEWWDSPSGAVGRAVALLKAATGADEHRDAGVVTPR